MIRGACLILACLALTVLAPLWLLLLAPLLLGVPHVLADFWCLFAAAPRRPARGFAAAIAPPLLALTGLMALRACSGWSLPRAEGLLGVAAIAAAIATAGGGARARALAWGVTGLLALAAAAFPRGLSLGFAYGHNLAAFALWRWFAAIRRPASGHVELFGLYAAAILALLCGAFEPLTAAAGGNAPPLERFTLAEVSRALAPGLEESWARGLVPAFAFTQAVHYAIWLHLLPSELRGGPESLAPGAWLRRAPRPILAGAALAAVAVPLLGLWRPVETREAYLSLAAFHGWLELAAAAHYALARPPSEAA